MSKIKTLLFFCYNSDMSKLDVQETSSIVADKKIAYKKNYRRDSVKLVLGCLVLTATFIAIFFYGKSNQTKKELELLSQQLKESNSQDILVNVENITEVPQNEEPTVATITDINKLKSQSFFSKAKNGDKLIIYKNSNRAILYRPSNNKIIEATTVALDGIDQTGNVEEINEDTKDKGENVIEPKTITVAVLNSTGVAGLAGSLSKQLETEFTDFKIEIEEVGDAKGSYEETFIVNRTNNEELRNQTALLAQYLKASVAAIPSEEDISDVKADIIIYIGKNTQ